MKRYNQMRRLIQEISPISKRGGNMVLVEASIPPPDKMLAAIKISHTPLTRIVKLHNLKTKQNKILENKKW